MKLTPSAHADTFCRDHLPPAEQWPDLEFTLPELAYPDRLNCAATLLADTISAYGSDRACLLPQDPDAQVWSYADLARAASQIAHVLTDDLGVVPGNRVLLRGPNNPWLVACWFGVLLAGGVVVATMPLLRSSELTTICDIAQVTLALCDDRFTDELAAADAPGLRLISFHGAAPSAPATGAEAGAPGNLNELASRKPETFDAAQTAADDVALIAFTSGTTGRPKAAMHFHRDVLAVADTFSAHVLKPTSDDIFTGTPPLAFTFGLGAILIFPIRAGAATLLIERATPAELADHIAARGVTVLSTAPTAYRAMLAAGKADQLRGLRRPVSAGETLPGETVEPITAMRRGIAEHMRRSLDTSAHVTSAIEVDMARVVAAREQLKAEYQAAYGVNPTYLAFVARAAVQTLANHPYVNGELRGDSIITRNFVNLGIAVELADGKGLIVPVLKNAETMNLLGLAKGIADIAKRARDKQLVPDDVQGGTFTITNPGGYGTFHGTPVISQPQAAILGTYAVVKRPWVVQDSLGKDVIAIRPMMNATLTYDHRLVDGAYAGRFLKELRERLEAWEGDGS